MGKNQQCGLTSTGTLGRRTLQGHEQAWMRGQLRSMAVITTSGQCQSPCDPGRHCVPWRKSAGDGQLPQTVLGDLMDCSTPGFPVHQQLPEIAQTRVHRVSDAIQPCHPLSSPSAAAAKSLQSCPTLCDPIDGSPPGSLSLGFSSSEAPWEVP